MEKRPTVGGGASEPTRKTGGDQKARGRRSQMCKCFLLPFAEGFSSATDWLCACSGYVSRTSLRFFVVMVEHGRLVNAEVTNLSVEENHKCGIMEDREKPLYRFTLETPTMCL